MNRKIAVTLGAVALLLTAGALLVNLTDTSAPSGAATGQSVGCGGDFEGHEEDVSIEVVTAGYSLKIQNNQTIITVGQGCGKKGEGTPEALCSLDDAIAEAASSVNPILELAPGTYGLSVPLTEGLTIRSQDALLPDTSLLDEPVCTEPGAPAKNLSEPTVILKKVGKSAPMSAVVRVELADAEQRVILSGISVVAAQSQNSPSNRPPVALSLFHGTVLLTHSLVKGRVSVSGAQARLLADHTRMRGGATNGSPDLGHIALGPGSKTYQPQSGLPGSQVQIPDGLCEAAALTVSDNATFFAVGLDVGSSHLLGVCADSGEISLCGGSIHEMLAAQDGSAGWGAMAVAGGRLDMQRVLLLANTEVGALADGVGSHLRLWDGSVVSQQRRGSSISCALGVVGQNQAVVEVSNSTISATQGPGVLLVGKAEGLLAASHLEANGFAHIVVWNADMNLETSTLTDPVADDEKGGPVAIYVDNQRFGPSNVELNGVTVEGSAGALSAVWVVGDGGTLTVDNSSISGFAGSAMTMPDGSSTMLHGDGVVAQGVCNGLTLTSVAFSNNHRTHILLDGSNCQINSGTWMPEDATALVQQNCSPACVVPMTGQALAEAGLGNRVTDLCPTHTLPIAPLEFTLYMEEAAVGQ